MAQLTSAQSDRPFADRESTLSSYSQAFPDVDLLALETHLALAGTSGAVTRGIEARIQAVGFELTRPRYTIVRILYLSPEQALPQSEIAQALSVSAANVTQLIDALAADGWVERVVNPADRRVTYAQLTEAGKQRCAVLVPAIVDYMLKSVRMLDADERAELRRLIGKVRDALPEA
jgi:DNA-binding MarR family transcriptional regulator